MQSIKAWQGILNTVLSIALTGTALSCIDATCADGIFTLEYGDTTSPAQIAISNFLLAAIATATSASFARSSEQRRRRTEIDQECELINEGIARRHADKGNKTGSDAPFRENSETNGRYHSDWLSMMYPRLRLARDLLADDGVIFISIDDNEQANLKRLCDEIFGAENFIAVYKWNKTATPPALSDKVRGKYEYVVCYEKVRSAIKYCGGVVTGGDMPLLNETNAEHELEFPSESVLFAFSGAFSKGQYDRVMLLDDVVIENGRANRPIRLFGKFKWVQDTVDKEISEGTTFIIKSKKFAIRYCRAGERIKRPSDIISKEECKVGTNEDGAKDVAALFGENIMSYPKPVALIKYLIPFAETSKDSLVLDFFSGSATTAHAVMALNAEDGGKRKFILVQVPEAAELGGAARDAGFTDICAIGEERIRRAGEKILGERPELRGTLDVGFRVLRVDSGNFERAEALPREAVASRAAWLASLRTDVLKAGRTEEDLLFEALGRQRAVPFSAGFAQEELAGARVWSVAGGTLLACLEGAGRVTGAVVEAMARRRPAWAVFREGGFADDTAKANMVQRFRQLSPETETWVL